MAAPVPAREKPRPVRRPALVGTLAVAALAASASAAQGPAQLRTMATLVGACERLTVAGADRTAACHGALGNLTYANGRSSFMFSDPETQMAISFSGLDEARAGEIVTLTLDLITRASGPEPIVNSEPATGSCEYSNPYAGRSYVRCAGTTASGPFAAVFTSNGAPPVIIRP